MSLNPIITISKITLGVGLSLLITELLGYGRDVTAPITLVVIMALSPAVHATKEQARSVFLSNLIGIPLGIVLPLFIGNYPLAVTLAVFISLILSYKMPWNTSFINSALTTMLVIYVGNMNSPFQYGENRFLLVLIGIIIAYIINNLIFPPNYGKTVHTSIQKTSNKIFLILKDFIDHKHWSEINKDKLVEIEGEIEEIGRQLHIFSKDIKHNKRRLKNYQEKKDCYEAFHVLLKVSTYVIYKLYYFRATFEELPEDVKEKLIVNLNHVLTRHEYLLTCFYEENIENLIKEGLDENINVSYDYREMAFKGSIAEYTLELNWVQKVLLTTLAQKEQPANS